VIDTVCTISVNDGRKASPELDFFTDYTCGSSMLDVSDSFEFHTSNMPNDRLIDSLVPGTEVSIHVLQLSTGIRTLQYVGNIENVELTSTRDGGTMFVVQGRDHMAAIVDACITPHVQIEAMTLADVARELLTKPFPGQTNAFYGPNQVTIDNAANRKVLTGKQVKGSELNLPPLEAISVSDAKPRAGETVYQYLDRHARRFGLMVWGTADGKVVISRPNYTQEPSYRLVVGASHIKSARWKRSMRSRPSEIHVYGKSYGHDFGASGIHAVLYDPDIATLGYYRPLVIHDQNARTKDHAEQRARIEQGKRLMNANLVEIVVPDHVDYGSGATWAIDTIAQLTWDHADFAAEPRHIVKRTFTRSRNGGTETQLMLTPLNAIPLGEVHYVDPTPVKAQTVSWRKDVTAPQYTAAQNAAFDQASRAP
jgi:prophage tail gpP-like protein